LASALANIKAIKKVQQSMFKNALFFCSALIRASKEMPFKYACKTWVQFACQYIAR